MELWIRSQDKTTLIRSYEIYISEQQNTYLIRAKRTSHILGSYSTIERAIEVLDEIQNILKPQLIIKDSGKIIGSFEDTIVREGATYELKELSTYVYQMPKK